MTTNQDVQTGFLTQFIEKKLPASVYLKSGIRLKGKITSFDSEVIFLEENGTTQLVYKNLISTIMPQAEFRSPA